MRSLCLSACFVAVVGLSACTTIFLEVEGECVIQTWTLANFVVRKRMICDLPQPGIGDPEVRDREPMDVNPFPGLLDRNDADSTDPDLLEKSMGLPQDVPKGK